jgi:predicted lysophospholipase L1 biosynthesis ABC-type transport system permease subunit
VIVRTSGDPASLAPALRQAMKEIDPNLAFQSLRTMVDVSAKSVAQQRFLATMLLVFAGVGMLLAIVGVYGVMAQLAADRAREMGIRIALGARAGQVQWIVVRRGIRLVAIGVAAGLGAAMIATRAVTAMLYGVGAWDPATFLVVSVALVVTAVVASWVPAFRVSRADPVGALRQEWRIQSVSATGFDFLLSLEVDAWHDVFGPICRRSGGGSCGRSGGRGNRSARSPGPWHAPRARFITS